MSSKRFTVVSNLNTRYGIETWVVMDRETNRAIVEVDPTGVMNDYRDEMKELAEHLCRSTTRWFAKHYREQYEPESRR